MVVAFSKISWRILPEQLLMSSMVYLRSFLSPSITPALRLVLIHKKTCFYLHLLCFWWFAKDMEPTGLIFFLAVAGKASLQSSSLLLKKFLKSSQVPSDFFFDW